MRTSDRAGRSPYRRDAARRRNRGDYFDRLQGAGEGASPFPSVRRRRGDRLAGSRTARQSSPPGGGPRRRSSGGVAFGTKDRPPLRPGLSPGDRILSRKAGGGGFSREELHRGPPRQRRAGDQGHKDDDHDARVGARLASHHGEPWDGTKSTCASTLGRYERILVLDAGIEPLTDEETLSFFDLVQVPVEIEKDRSLRLSWPPHKATGPPRQGADRVCSRSA